MVQGELWVECRREMHAEHGSFYFHRLFPADLLAPRVLRDTTPSRLTAGRRCPVARALVRGRGAGAGMV